LTYICITSRYRMMTLSTLPCIVLVLILVIVFIAFILVSKCIIIYRCKSMTSLVGGINVFHRSRHWWLS